MADFVRFDAKELGKIFDEMLERGERIPAAVLPNVAQILVSAVEDEFATEGRGKWQQLADETLARRRREGRGAKILQDTGIFAGSITPFVGADFAEALTNVPYAVFHTSDAPRKIIPYRNPFDIDMEAAEQQMIDLVLQAAVPG